MIKGMRLAAAIVISMGCLGWVFRSLDWVLFRSVLAQAQWQWVAWGVACFGVSLGVRAVRWWWCVSRLVPQTRMIQIIAPLYIGYLLNMVLPGKLGEIVKLLILSRKTQVSSVQATVSILMDRLTDGLGLAMVMGGALWVLPFHALSWSVWVAGAMFFGGVAVSVVGVAFLPPLRVPALWIADRCRLRSARAILVDGIAGLRQLNAPHMWVGLLALSVANWIAEAGLFVMVAKALTGKWVVGSATVMMGMASFGGIVLATPAGIGSHEFLVLKGAIASGVVPTLGIAIGLLTHIVLVVPTGIAGAIALLTDAGKYLKIANRPVS